MLFETLLIHKNNSFDFSNIGHTFTFVSFRFCTLFGPDLELTFDDFTGTSSSTEGLRPLGVAESRLP